MWHALRIESRMVSPALLDFPLSQRICVIIPARDEAAGISASLRALCEQVDRAGRPVRPATYDILVLANNCQDDTAEIARAIGASYPAHGLHVYEACFPPEHAHIGSARRWLMDHAVEWLGGTAHPRRIIASTDADTIVAPTWLVEIAAEIEL